MVRIQTGPECRICLESECTPETGPLEASGCACKGSNGHVHSACLVSTMRHFGDTCRVCRLPHFDSSLRARLGVFVQTVRRIPAPPAPASPEPDVWADKDTRNAVIRATIMVALAVCVSGITPRVLLRVVHTMFCVWVAGCGGRITLRDWVILMLAGVLAVVTNISPLFTIALPASAMHSGRDWPLAIGAALLGLRFGSMNVFLLGYMATLLLADVGRFSARTPLVVSTGICAALLMSPELLHS